MCMRSDVDARLENLLRRGARCKDIEVSLLDAGRLLKERELGELRRSRRELWALVGELGLDVTADRTGLEDNEAIIILQEQ